MVTGIITITEIAVAPLVVLSKKFSLVVLRVIAPVQTVALLHHEATRLLPVPVHPRQAAVVVVVKVEVACRDRQDNRSIN
jgi:hypothetical protein